MAKSVLCCNRSDQIQARTSTQTGVNGADPTRPDQDRMGTKNKAESGVSALMYTSFHLSAHSLYLYPIPLFLPSPPSPPSLSLLPYLFTPQSQHTDPDF